MDEQKYKKGIEGKNYGSIPHLPGSRLGPADRHCNEGQARIATEKCRKGDLVIVQEKLDGSNVGVYRQRNKVIALTRNGYLAKDSDYLHHRIFAEWVTQNAQRFLDLLADEERLVGEWMAVVSINCEPSEKSREEALASVLQIDWFDLLVEDPAKFDRMKKTVENNSLRLRLCGAIEEKLIADVDLSGVDLSGSVFKRCHFNGCNFHNSKLHFVTFDNSYLTYCSFVDADLEGMKVEKCTVQGSNLDNARMKGSKWLRNAITDTPLCFEQDDKPTFLDNIMFNSGPKQYLSSTGADKSLQEKIESLKKRINEL